MEAKPITCDSYAYTRRRGGCGLPAVRLLTVTYEKRRTTRYRLCDRHADGLYEDLADRLFAYLRHTGVTEAKIPQEAEPTAPRAVDAADNAHRPETGAP
ncbi:hypothetical protein [Streptomyces sp. NRRL S-350]|uniref:hypothetical protein n=1 Tax=Streptomyces sp. NRRL S-350 TaxID=1463902 RepID=UPI0004C166DA|nr:hypothetical protein [Streptomyces sp. NRRL S-350]